MNKQTHITFNDLEKVVEQVASLEGDALAAVSIALEANIERIEILAKKHYDLYSITKPSGDSNESMIVSKDLDSYHHQLQELRKASALRLFIQTIQNS